MRPQDIPRDFYVYDDNKYPSAAVTASVSTITGSVEDIAHPSLTIAPEFNSTALALTVVFPFDTLIDSVVISNTNATRMRIAQANNITVSRNTDNDPFVVIFTQPIVSRTLSIHLNAPFRPLHIGSIYAGMRTKLPRNGATVEEGLRMFSRPARTFGGMSYGLRQKVLRTFSFQFPWVTPEDKRAIERIVANNQNIGPHILDPYPEARAKWPPRHVTLDDADVSFEKRPNDDFVYMAQLTWMEVA